MNAWRALWTFSAVILQVDDSGFGLEQQEQGQDCCAEEAVSHGVMLAGSLPLKSQFSHVGSFFSSISLFWRDKEWRGFPQHCFSYWGVFLCVPSPSKPEICTGRIKEQLIASDDCIVTPFLWAWGWLYLRPQILHHFCLDPLQSALYATLCRGLTQLA